MIEEGEMVEGFEESIMKIYDLATELAEKEAKEHREVFNILCEYIDVNCRLEQQKLELDILNQKIEDAKKENIILTAIKEGKVGRG